MIEGMKIDVGSGELREHLLARADHHKDRRAFYLGQVKSLRDGQVEENLVVSNDPIRSLEQSAKSHGEREGFFRFLADHLILDETYRLTENDLTRLELLDRYL